LEIKGQVEEIIYQNEVNSYTVADFNVDGELITAVGYLPFIVEGDCLKLIGRIVNHPDYGEQLKIDTFEKIMPETIEALEKYLAGGIIKGVGPVLAKRIVNSFREDTISVLKFEPDRLSGVKGITLSKAEEISEEFNQKWELWQVVGFLEKFGISGANSKKVYEKLGPDARSKIEENPYILLDITYGVDFKKIDKMAMDLGLSDINDERIKSGIKYSLVLASYNGNTCVVKENLISFVKDLLDVEEEYIEEQLINLKAKQEIFIEKQEKTNWVYLDTFFKCEQNIADKIVALNKSKNIKEIKNLDKELEKIEKKEDIKLSKEQKDAIYAVNDNNVCVITGGPGTGKTTIIKFIIELFKLKGKKVVLCAPTGRAAKRMQEATGEDASTIHGLLAI
jgi:exodeoxyribonuclease V alpha subunit